MSMSLDARRVRGMVFSAAGLNACMRMEREKERRNEAIRLALNAARVLFLRARRERAARACLDLLRDRLVCLGLGAANGLLGNECDAPACVDTCAKAVVGVCCRDDDRLRCCALVVDMVDGCGYVQGG